ncbi:MAG: hypothetical protein WD080_04275 [Egibacteraceae bacterium]
MTVSDEGTDTVPVLEKQLRLGLVVYGGGSLAIYMHGTTARPRSCTVWCGRRRDRTETPDATPPEELYRGWQAIPWRWRVPWVLATVAWASALRGDAMAG